MTPSRYLSVLLLVFFLPCIPALGQEVKLSVTVKAVPDAAAKESFRFSGTITGSTLYPKGQLGVGNDVTVTLEYIEPGGKFRTLPEWYNLRHGPAKGKTILTPEEQHGIKAKGISLFGTGLSAENEGKAIKFDKVLKVPQGAAAYRVVAVLTHRWSGTWTAIVYKHDVYTPAILGGSGTKPPEVIVVIQDDTWDPWGPLWESQWPKKPEPHWFQDMKGKPPGILPAKRLPTDVPPIQKNFADNLIGTYFSETLPEYVSYNDPLSGLISSFVAGDELHLTLEQIAILETMFVRDQDMMCSLGYYSMEVITKLPTIKAIAPVQIQVNVLWAFLKGYHKGYDQTGKISVAWKCGKEALIRKSASEGIALLGGKMFGKTMNDLYGIKQAKWVGYVIKNGLWDIGVDARTSAEEDEIIRKSNEKKQKPNLKPIHSFRPTNRWDRAYNDFLGKLIWN